MRLKYIFLVTSLLLLSLVGVMVWREWNGNFVSMLLCEGCIALTIMFMWLFYRNVVKPANVLKRASSLIEGADFSSRLRSTGQPDMDEVIDVFNHMLASLSEQRLRVREINEMLDIMISVMPTGVVIIDSNDRVKHLNRSAARFLELSDDNNVNGIKLADINHPLAVVMDEMEVGTPVVTRINGTKIYRCNSCRFFNMGVPHKFYIIEEMTRDVMEVQRQSYRKVLRLISHEVNNTMAGLNATLEILEQDIADTLDSDMQDSIASLLRRNRAVVKFISALADTARIPAPQCSRFDLTKMLTDVIATMQEQWKDTQVTFELHTTSDEAVIVQADYAQMQQVLVNVMKNAAESIISQGMVRIEVDPAGPTLVVTDDGKPISHDVADQLFTPFFTTKPQGQGIGLMMIAEILDNHGFSYSLATSPSDGLTRFTITFR